MNENEPTSVRFLMEDLVHQSFINKWIDDDLEVVLRFFLEDLNIFIQATSLFSLIVQEEGHFSFIVFENSKIEFTNSSLLLLL